MLIDSRRKPEADKKFDADESGVSFSNRLFLRLVAKDKTFKNVDFKYSIFDSCYLRGCKFDSCDFTGCRFVGTNLHGSKFSGCTFDYATFEKTAVESDILDTECPGPENLKARFARSLRTNYQQLGDVDGANKAMNVELLATELHLHKAWRSNESYYRSHYRGWHRGELFFQWCKFKALDFIWGNGERPGRLFRSVLFILAGMSIFDVMSFGDPQRISNYISSLETSFGVFLGVSAPPHYPLMYLACITFIRLVAVAFFLSIVIKKFNRR